MKAFKKLHVLLLSWNEDGSLVVYSYFSSFYDIAMLATDAPELCCSFLECTWWSVWQCSLVLETRVLFYISLCVQIVSFHSLIPFKINSMRDDLPPGTKCSLRSPRKSSADGGTLCSVRPITIIIHTYELYAPLPSYRMLSSIEHLTHLLIYRRSFNSLWASTPTPWIFILSTCISYYFY